MAMTMNGEYQLPVARETVWEKLNDAETLKACIPGCESLDKLSDTEFQAVAVTKIGPVKAKFKGKVTLSDLDPPNGYKISGQGDGGVAGFAKGGATVGIGAGQTSRVDSARIAALKAAEAARAAGLPESLAKGSVVASDAFFPFADGLLAAAEAGATAIIQPGGSMHDGEVVKAADGAGLAMVFTGARHFRH